MAKLAERKATDGILGQDQLRAHLVKLQHRSSDCRTWDAKLELTAFSRSKRLRITMSEESKQHPLKFNSRGTGTWLDPRTRCTGITNDFDILADISTAFAYGHRGVTRHVEVDAQENG